jgi:RNA polymerase sigma factor (sigma-70 family)
MTDVPDARLLEQFARNGSEEAFGALVQRHIALVHSVALRHTANAQHAQDITQAVFVILARKAGSLGRKTVLPGWLYHTARLTAANLQRAETSRVRREQEAFMQSQLEESVNDALWRELSPQLDEAMAGLGTSERDALVLRYFQNKSMAEVGQFLGLAENTAQKRVSRALEKLRAIFAKRGVSSTTAILAGVISANSVQAVPVTLAKSVTAVAIAKGAVASASTLTLIKGALKIMAWTKAKTAIVVGVAVISAATTGTIVIKAINRPLPKLETRAFKTRAFKGDRTFVENLRKVTGASSAESVPQIASNYFVSKGIDFRSPKSIAFNDAQSLLFVKATASDLNAIEKIIQQLAYAPPQVHYKARFIKVPESNVESILKAGTVVDTKEGNIVEIMSSAQTSLLLRGLRASGATTLSEPEVTTLSGRQTQMRSGDTTVDLVSTLFDDGYTLKMTVIVSTPENLLANVNTYDDQTIVLAPNNSNDGKTRLLVFVTSTLIDSAGNRIHSKNELPFNPSAIPPQE